MMKKILFIILLFFCCQKANTQSISLPELNLGTSFYFDQWVLNTDTFFVAPIYIDTYIDFNEFHLNIKYNHNVVEPLISELNQINDDSYIMVANYMGVADFAMVSGGNITGVVNTINASQSLLTLSFSGSVAAQTLFNSCNGNLLYLAFKKVNPCFKGPFYLQFWNGDDNGTFINPIQTHACQIIGITSTYSTETGNLLAVQGEVTFDIPQANIQVNGNALEALVQGGTLPLSYEWSDKFGTVLGSGYNYLPTDTGMVVLTVIDADGCMSVTSHNFYFSSSSVVEESSRQNIYPNPSMGVIYIHNEIDRIVVLNLMGMVYYDGKEKVIDLTNLQKGVYLIQITRHNYTITEKIILH